jgi:hypothetical protein
LSPAKAFRPSVKEPMSGHPLICPETLVADEKPDTMIAGREDGRPSGPGERSDRTKLPSRARSRLRQLILKILRHLMIKMTDKRRVWFEYV